MWTHVSLCNHFDDQGRILPQDHNCTLTGSYWWIKPFPGLDGTAVTCKWKLSEFSVRDIKHAHLLIWPVVLLGVTCGNFVWVEGCPGPFFELSQIHCCQYNEYRANTHFL